MLAHSGPPWAEQLAPHILPSRVFGRTGFTAREGAVTSSASDFAPKRDESMATMEIRRQQDSRRVLQRTVLAAEASVGLLRRYAETALIKWDLACRVDDGRVVVSELATNAVRARSGAGDRPLTFRISLLPD